MTNSDHPRGDDRYSWVEVASEQELHEGLQHHHGQPDAVWLVTWNTAVPDIYLPHEQVLDQLVAFGWTDGIRRRTDDECTRQLISPRRTQPSAKLGVERVHDLGVGRAGLQPYWIVVITCRARLVGRYPGDRIPGDDAGLASARDKRAEFTPWRNFRVAPDPRLGRRLQRRGGGRPGVAGGRRGGRPGRAGSVRRRSGAGPRRRHG